MAHGLRFDCFSLDGNKRAIVFFLGENHGSGYEGEEGVVFADAYVFSGMVTSSALADDDVPGDGFLASENFNTQSFAFRFASVLRTADAFLVCHALKLRLLFG